MAQDKSLWKELPARQAGIYRKYRDGMVEIQAKIRGKEEIAAFLASVEIALTREFELGRLRSQKEGRSLPGVPLREVKALRPTA
ncbi:MAG: hypothetical protein HS115_01565 [Spirochaetales bacterium]|nr:hypothetical protein [Spirochaetales bacterium]